MYPGKCVTIDHVLAWNNLRPLQMDGQGGKPAIEAGVMYVPLRDCSNIDPSETYCHGTPLSSLWSILATGVVRGAYYTELNSPFGRQPIRLSVFISPRICILEVDDG